MLLSYWENAIFPFFRSISKTKKYILDLLNSVKRKENCLKHFSFIKLTFLMRKIGIVEAPIWDTLYLPGQHDLIGELIKFSKFVLFIRKTDKHNSQIIYYQNIYFSNEKQSFSSPKTVKEFWITPVLNKKCGTFTRVIEDFEISQNTTEKELLTTIFFFYFQRILLRAGKMLGLRRI